MKKIIPVLLLMLSAAAFAAKYPCSGRKLSCRPNYLPSIDGQCYRCDYPKVIWPECGVLVRELCPKRLVGGDGGSYLQCPEDREFLNDRCLLKCPKGFHRVGNGETCKNPKTGAIIEWSH